MIGLLADENVPRASVHSLRAAGLDVVSVTGRIPGASDSAVLELARSENRLLLTFDSDFGELIYRRGHAAPAGVVFLRFVPANPEETADVVRNLLAHTEIVLDGRFTVVTRDQVRQRVLP